MEAGIKRINTRDMVMCSLFAALIAIGAFIRIPVPYVPFTMQLLFTTLAGVLLGSKKGALSVGIYLAVGLIGIPVFTKGGGIGYIFQPTFGYLIGFMVGAYVTGKIVEKYKKPTIKQIIIASLAGLSVIYLIGVPYYYIIMNMVIDSPIGVMGVLTYGFLMCLPGDIFSCIFCGYVGKRMLPIIEK